MRLFDLFSNICEFTTHHTKDISLELQDTSTATVNERKVFCNSREETLTLPEQFVSIVIEGPLPFLKHVTAQKFMHEIE